MEDSELVGGGGYMEEQCIQQIAKKKPMKREESNFETCLSIALSYMKCAYIKIPDPIYTMARARARKEGNDPKSRKRPFDGMIVTNSDDSHSGGIYAVEAKFGNNTLEQHQLDYLTTVNKINGMGYVIRKKEVKRKVNYTIEWPEKNVLYSCDNLNDFVKWFKELSRTKK